MNRRLLAVAVAVLLAVPAASAEARRPMSPSLTRHTLGSRSYLLYVPGGKIKPHRPMVVFLHGCLTTAADAAAATGFVALAEERDFVAIFPDQTVTPGTSAPLADGNGMGCWNWFLPEHQVRDSGEPAAIADITRHVAATQRVDRRRVYVEGISAGGDMAVILAATYPDVYAAAGVIAGCAYATCSDATGVLAYRAMGERARVVPMFVAQGTADVVNNYAMGAGLATAWVGTADWADDGMANGSVSPVPARVEPGTVPPPAPDPAGDPCVRNRNWPCAAGPLGWSSYPTTVTAWADGAGREFLELWTIHGLGHAHPAARSAGPFTDPAGPDVTVASYEFFLNHALPR